jgi:hypothetical protein
MLSVFKYYSSRRFVFVKPGGNYGDHLIYRGAKKVAREAGVDFRSITHRECTSYDVLKSVLPRQVDLQTDHDTALRLEASELPGADVGAGAHTFYAIRNDKGSRTVTRQRKPFRMWFDLYRSVLLSRSGLDTTHELVPWLPTVFIQQSSAPFW